MTSSTNVLITCTPGLRGGTPSVAGTRITVSDVLEVLASGMSREEILADFPDRSAEHVLAVLRYAAEREQRLTCPPPRRDRRRGEKKRVWDQSGGSSRRYSCTPARSM